MTLSSSGVSRTMTSGNWSETEIWSWRREPNPAGTRAAPVVSADAAAGAAGVVEGAACAQPDVA